MKSPDRKLSRRSFLAAVGAGGASAAVALVAKDKPADAARRSDAAKADEGYRLTEHIRKYYRTTQV
jgi:hypothetical protein